MIQIDWSALDGRLLEDGDRINLSVATLDLADDDPLRFGIRVVLRLGPGLTWWKMVELTRFDGERLTTAEVHDQHTLAECAAGVTPGEARKLVLWKAKAFGIHTPMYVLLDLAQFRGKQVMLDWVQD